MRRLCDQVRTSKSVEEVTDNVFAQHGIDPTNTIRRAHVPRDRRRVDSDPTELTDSTMTAGSASISTDSRAASLDGRRFHFIGAFESSLQPGTLVTLHSDTNSLQLGQVDSVTFSIGEQLSGSGRILGALSEGARLDRRQTFPFESASVEHAHAGVIELLYSSFDAPLVIGSYATSNDMPARLLPSRFNRHTFWCGQSGSGKTYSLGVVLEQILIHTSLPMVIFDPNGDFVRLREPNGGSEDSEASRIIAGRDIRILRPSSPNPDSLRVRFTDLPLQSKGAVLGLHPLDDRAEYNELIHLEEAVGVLPPERVVSTLLERGSAAAQALAARIENLQITEWGLWAGTFSAVTDILESRPDATVLDLGGFVFAEESLVAVMAVLDDLWAKRERRRPILIVIDEAHNFCSPEQHSPLHVAVRERLIQIAAEGRKFGLWLLLSTQRPSRIHPSIISQCDNLALMKMTSPGDLMELATIFGSVPAAMINRSPGFRQGEALFAGGFVPAPTIVTMGSRLTMEGGADVRVPMRKVDLS
jgi:hypothetical protein